MILEPARHVNLEDAGIFSEWLDFCDFHFTLDRSALPAEGAEGDETVALRRHTPARTGLIRSRPDCRDDEDKVPGTASPPAWQSRGHYRPRFQLPPTLSHLTRPRVGRTRLPEFLPGQGCPSGKPARSGGSPPDRTVIPPCRRNAGTLPVAPPGRRSPVHNPQHLRPLPTQTADDPQHAPDSGHSRANMQRPEMVRQKKRHRRRFFSVHQCRRHGWRDTDT